MNTRNREEGSKGGAAKSEEGEGNGIPVEVWKCMGEEGVDMLWDLLQKIYEQEKMPEWHECHCTDIQGERHPGADFMNRRRLCQLTAAILTSDLTTHISGFYEATQRLSCNYTALR